MPTDTHALEALLEWVREAEGPDRELDAEIAEAFQAEVPPGWVRCVDACGPETEVVLEPNALASPVPDVPGETGRNSPNLADAIDPRDEIIASLVEALTSLLLTAKVLRQNAEGCAVNHYGNDFEVHGLPGWLDDCQRDIDAASAALSRATEGAKP